MFLVSEFTVNMISNWFIESANFTSGSFDPGVDEVDMSGLTPMPSVRVCADHHVLQCCSSNKASEPNSVFTCNLAR